MPYKLIDHTADLGIYAAEQSLEGLFETAALAMFEQIVDTGSLTGARRREVAASGTDLPDLMVEWLRELLSLWNMDGCLVKKADVRGIENCRLSAVVNCDVFDPDRHEILADIKAVTYHGIRVEQTEKGWEAYFIFDV